MPTVCAFKLTLIDGGYAVTGWIDRANFDSDVKEMGSGLPSLTKRQYMTGCDFQAKTIRNLFKTVFKN